MSTITKERVAEFIKNLLDNGLTRGEQMVLARIALASLEAEPVGYVDAEYAELLKSGHIESCSVYAEPGEGCITVFSAPPAPVSVPDEIESTVEAIKRVLPMSNPDEYAACIGADMWNACRAAMLQGSDTELHSKAAIHDVLCEKYNVESLADFVDWQRNHIAELEAAPPAPVGKGETAVMPDYPGYALTQRECYQAGKKAGMAELVTTAYKLPFEQWLSQQTGTIDVECGCVMTEVFFHWLRVAYEAGNYPVIPDGLRLALSNAGIAAPESDEMLAATCEKYIQALVTWVKDRKPFQPAAPHFREIVNSSTNNCRENAETSTKCWCRTCRPVKLNDMRFVVCPDCGNKRCPHANDHRNACTGSNEPGQEGSAYPATPQQEAK